MSHNNSLSYRWSLCFSCRMCVLVSRSGKMWPPVKTHWFINECTLLTFVISCCVHCLHSVLLPLFVASSGGLRGVCEPSVWRFFFSECPWRCPDVLAAPVFIELTLHSSGLIKGSSHRGPTGLVPGFSGTTRCVINGERLQWKGAAFNKVENVYPIKLMQGDGVSHLSSIPRCADMDVYAQEYSLCVSLHWANPGLMCNLQGWRIYYVWGRCRIVFTSQVPG